MINIDIAYINFTQLSDLLCVCVCVCVLYPETKNSDCLVFKVRKQLLFIWR